MADSAIEGGVAELASGKTHDWYAWINRMPPPPDEFHIVGEVEVANPGVIPVLVPRVPQGINPRHFQLVLLLLQMPGFWPQVIVRKQVRFDKPVKGYVYDVAEIFSGGSLIEQVPVDDVV